MTDQQHDELVKRMSVLNERMEERGAMIGKLSWLGARFPDDDLHGRFEAIKAEAKRRNEIDARSYGKLEETYRLLGGPEWERENIEAAV